MLPPGWDLVAAYAVGYGLGLACGVLLAVLWYTGRDER